MFGYVKIKKAELRVKEYEYYRAAYCGLCRSMGKCTGQCSRLTLSYDVAFLVHIRMLLRGTAPTFRARRCVAHPLRRRVMMEPNDELSFAARVSALLAYQKCRDDVADKRGFPRFAARLRSLFLRGAYRRAKKHLPVLAALFAEKLSALSALEREKRPTVDQPASLFGEMLAAAMSEGMPEKEARIAARIGEKMGRFIYIVDAIDDLEGDEKSGNFNPVMLLYGKKPDEAQKNELHDALIACLADMEAALDLVSDTDQNMSRPVIENILYLGMPDTVKRVLYGEGCCEEDKRE